MPTPIDNTEWRKQWMHQKQFEHKLEDLRKLGLQVEDEQLRCFYLTSGYGFVPMALDDISLELDAPICDQNGQPVILPWVFELESAQTSLYHTLDDTYTDWRTWPSFTGFMEPMGGCYDQHCYRCGPSDWYSEESVIAVPVWEAIVFIDFEEAAKVREYVREQLNNTNYAEWYHYWCDQQWGPLDGVPKVTEPDDPLIMYPIKMPTEELQQRWEAILEAAEHNRQLCRSIEHRENLQRIEFDNRAIARRERMDQIPRKTG